MKPADKYYIEFNCAPDGKMIEGYSVALAREFIRDMDTSLRIDLCCHPLYPALEKYVLANPTKKD